jgi:hypothetical protein
MYIRGSIMEKIVRSQSWLVIDVSIVVSRNVYSLACLDQVSESEYLNLPVICLFFIYK